ncbi:unnamed protein product [Pleuronectes platessa]|uniref:Ig-like domain-containing protein n=1 Tax=Pleuronectes platessa TaxID=8262 RepID=A0A9N7TN06_PLEPL|nr:unnamed protein product [Pleuronectes platessa]
MVSCCFEDVGSQAVGLPERKKTNARRNVASICLVLSATLTVQLDRSQFHRYDSIKLSCADAYSFDSGLYWRESDGGECINAINLTITDGKVILKSSALPVMEAEEVVLVCLYKEDEDGTTTSNFSANFYKDGVVIGTRASGEMTFPSVSKSDEGLYMCEHPTEGRSPQSWFSVSSKVRAQPLPPPPPPPLMSPPRLVFTILLIVLYTRMLIVALELKQKEPLNVCPSVDQTCLLLMKKKTSYIRINIFRNLSCAFSGGVEDAVPPAAPCPPPPVLLLPQ